MNVAWVGYPRFCILLCRCINGYKKIKKALENKLWPFNKGDYF